MRKHRASVILCSSQRRRAPYGVFVSIPWADSSIAPNAFVSLSEEGKATRTTSTRSELPLLGVATDPNVVAVAGAVEGFRGLKVGQAYYLGSDGSLVASRDRSAGERWVRVGVALTPSRLLLQIQHAE